MPEAENLSSVSKLLVSNPSLNRNLEISVIRARSRTRWTASYILAIKGRQPKRELTHHCTKEGLSISLSEVFLWERWF